MTAILFNLLSNVNRRKAAEPERDDPESVQFNERALWRALSFETFGSKVSI